MEGKKIAGGLALGIISVIVLGIILAFVVFNSGEAETEPDAENSTNSESHTAEINESTDEFSGTDYFTEETETDIQDETDAESEAESAEETETQQPTADRTAYFGTWKPSKVEDGMTGEEISFNEAFGNDFYQLENSLTLSEDGTFTLVLGTAKNEDEGKGVFTADGDGLKVTYDSGKSDIFKFTKDGEGNIIYILVPKYNFTVYFERA